MSIPRLSRPTMILGFAVAALLLVTLGPGWSGQSAEAFTRCGTQFTYYSGPDLTEVVGVQAWLPAGCGCGYSSWGKLTAYRTFSDTVC